MINFGQITVFIQVDLFVTHGLFFFGRGAMQEIFIFVVRANFVGKKGKKVDLNLHHKKYSTYLAPFSTKTRI